MKKLLPIILVLLLALNVYAEKEPPTQTDRDIKTNTDTIAGDTTSMDNKIPLDPATEAKQDSIIANQTNGTQKTKVLDGSGNSIGSLRGALDVHDSDAHWEHISQSIVATTANTTLIDTSAAKGATTINVINGAGFLVGDFLIIRQGNTYVGDHFTVTAKPAANQITLDAPIDIALTATATVTEITHNIASTAGTLAAPITYSSGPPSGEVWHITCITLTITDNVAMDYTTFGGIAALTNGVLIRVNKNNGTYTTLDKIKNNQEMEDVMEVEYEPKAPAGEYGMNAKWHMKDRMEAIIRLDGTTGDKLEIVVQDDITTLIDFHGIIQGHKEGI